MLKREKMTMKCVILVKERQYNVAQSCKSSQIEKSQEKSTYNNTQIDNNECLR